MCPRLKRAKIVKKEARDVPVFFTQGRVLALGRAVRTVLLREVGRHAVNALPGIASKGQRHRHRRYKDYKD